MEFDNIYNIDCIEGFKQLQDKSIDLALTDPPYNRGIDYGEYYFDKKPIAEYFDWCKSWFQELERVCKLIVFTPGDLNLFFWIAYRKPLGCFCWYSPNKMGRRWYVHHVCWEPILAYGRFIKKLSRDAWEIPISIQSDVGLFPDPKPLRLWEILLKEFSKEGNTVLDPFCGSGTTAVVCKKLRRPFIGFEINPEYCEIAKNRLLYISPNQKLQGWFNQE